MKFSIKKLPIRYNIANMKKAIVIIILFGSIGWAVYQNIADQESENGSTLPAKITKNENFTAWVDEIAVRSADAQIDLSPDRFDRKDEREIYFWDRLNLSTLDDEEFLEEKDALWETYSGLDGVTFSPNGKIFIDYRNIFRRELNRNQVNLYGQRESILIDARILDCTMPNRCFFDTGYFINEDTFVIHELTVENTQEDCSLERNVCNYTVKIHLVELHNNKRSLYEGPGINLPILDKSLLFPDAPLQEDLPEEF